MILQIVILVCIVVQISDLPNGEYPICLHRTEASLLCHELAHIILHLLLMQSSTFPRLVNIPYLLITRTDPCSHGPRNLFRRTKFNGEVYAASSLVCCWHRENRDWKAMIVDI